MLVTKSEKLTTALGNEKMKHQKEIQNLTETHSETMENQILCSEQRIQTYTERWVSATSVVKQEHLPEPNI